MADADDQLEGQGTEGGEPEGTEDGGQEGAGDGGRKPQSDPKVDKRISDLQSQLDKERAERNKLEKALKGSGSGESGKGEDPELAATRQELREASLDAILGEFPELKEFGIDRALIEGKTRAEMRESATSLVGLIKSVSTKARNKALADAGVQADPAGATRGKPKDFNAMSTEDFEREISLAKSGGSPIW